MTPSRKDFILPAIILFFFLAFMARAYSHNADMGWAYDPYCCNGNQDHGDCQEIDSKTVKPVDGGYLVTLNPGDHRLVTTPHTYMVPNDKVKYSPDGHYHACLWPSEDKMQCFYAPPMGM